MEYSRLIISAITFLAAATTMPIFGALAEPLGLTDVPGPLKIHTRPIPMIGGLGIVVALVVGLALARIPRVPGAWSFLLALAAICLIGLIDDLRGLSVFSRLAAEASAALLLWRGGWQVPVYGNPLVSFVATALVVTFFINAFNMLDGSDGLCAGVAGIIALGYTWPGLTPHSLIAGVVAWGLVASCAGFLLFNFPPANVFLGDCGSMTLGFLVAFLALDYYRTPPLTASRFVAPLLLAGLPLSDAVISIARRLLDKRSPFAGDRGHFYDLLLLYGWPPRLVACVYYLLTGIFALLGCACSRIGATAAILLSALVFASIVFCALRLVLKARLSRINAPKNEVPIQALNSSAQSRR